MIGPNSVDQGDSMRGDWNGFKDISIIIIIKKRNSHPITPHCITPIMTSFMCLCRHNRMKAYHYTVFK